MALYLKTQETPEEIGRTIEELVRNLERINKNFSVLEPREVSGKRIGDYFTSIKIGNDIFDIVIQGDLNKESKGLLVEKIGYERNMNIWFYRIKGNLEGRCFPLTESETKFARYIGRILIEEGKAERATLASPKERIKSEKGKNLYKVIEGKEKVFIGNLKGIKEDYDFEHFHE